MTEGKAGDSSNMPYLSCMVNSETLVAAYDEVLEIPYDGLLHNVIVNNAVGTPTGTKSARLAITNNECYEVYVDDIILRWRINPSSFPKPIADETEYTYEGNSTSYNKIPTISNYNPNVMTRTPTTNITSAYKAGTYSYTYALKDPNSATWDDGTTDDVVVSWTIKKLAVPIPCFTPIEGVTNPEIFTYDGKSYTPDIMGYDSKFMSRSGHYSSYANAGKYAITYSLIDTTSCYWDDEEKSTTPKILNWEIQKAVQRYPKPTLDSSNLPFTYNGISQTPTVLNFVSSVMAKTGTQSSVAACKLNNDDEYIPWEITVEFKANSNYVYKWDDDDSAETVNSAEKVILPWIVERAAITEPYFENGISEFSFTSTSITPVVNGYNTNVMTRSGSTYATNPNQYSISYTLKDSASAWWENHPDNKTITLEWEIVKAIVPVPVIGETTFVVIYTTNGLPNQRPTINCNKNLVNLSGYDSLISNRAGKYSYPIKLKYPQYSVWEDTGTNEDKTVEWEILPLIEYAVKPTVNGDSEFMYDGAPHTLVLNDYPQLSQYYFVRSGNRDYLQKLALSNDSVQKATLPGEYSVTITPLMNGCSQIYWVDDKTLDSITFNWRITKGSYPKPHLKKGAFKFSGTSHTIEDENFVSSVMTRSGTTNATAVGEYEIVYSLKDKSLTMWEDGTMDNVVIKWCIRENEPLKIPAVSSLEFVYDGNRHSVTIEDYDKNLIKQSGDVSATNAGNYKITFSLIDSNSSIWEDGTYEDKTIEWVINKKVENLPKPHLDGDEYIYDAVNFTPDIIDFISSKMIKSGDLTKRKAGNYNIVISLSDNSNFIYKWADDSTDNVVLEWEITPITIPVPRIAETLFYYGGMTYNAEGHYISHSWRQPLIEGFSTIKKYVTYSGVINKKALITNEWDIGTQYTNDGNCYGKEQWSLGKYYITIEPTDPESCTWVDSGTAEKIDLEWSIVREVKLIPKPELLEGEFVYDGTKKTPVLSNTDVGVALSDKTDSIAAGNYIVTATPKIPKSSDDLYDYRWEDNTTDPIHFDWTIAKNTALNVPTLDVYSYEYNGETHKPAIIGYDKNVMSVKGYSEQTAIGSYDIIFSLTDQNSGTWSDGSVEDKVVTWTITRARFKKPTISPEYITYDGERHTVEINENESEHSFIVSGFNTDVMTISGTTQATVVGDYVTVISLKDTSSAEWDDGTTGSVELSWKIIKKIVKLDRPYLEQNSFVYDGNRKSPKALSPTKNYLDTGILLGGDLSAVNVGNYGIVFSLSEHHDITYLWGDLSSEPFDLPWEITPIEVEVPKASPLDFVYDGTLKSPNITNYNSSFVNMTGMASATNQGTYTVTFSLKNKTSTAWNGGGTADVVYTWKIKRKPLSINGADIFLSPVEFEFDKKSHLPDITNYDGNVMTRENYTQQTEYGEYNISVFPKDNYTWADGTSAAVVLKWRINKKILDKPDISPKSFVYDGTAKTPDTIGYDSAYMSYSRDKTKTASGDYQAEFSLKNSHSCEWADGTTENVVINWKILSASIKKPHIENTLFVYDGEIKVPDIIDYNSNVINIRGTQSSRTPNKYTITFSLKDPNSAKWEDGTTENVVCEWEILKKQLKKPTIENTEFTYNGGQHQPTLLGYDATVMNKSGTETATDAGDYSIVISLNDTNCYEWTDNTFEDVSLAWKIKRRSVEKPVLEPTAFVYDGKSHIPDISGFKSVAMKRDGYEYKTAIDEYTITISLNVNYEWADGTVDPVDLVWAIIEFPTEIPTAENLEFTYDGTMHSPKISSFDTDKVVLSGTSSAVNAGDYRIIFKLADKLHNVWSDGTSEDIVIPWVIRKIKLSLEVSNTEFVYNAGVHLPTISNFDSSKMSYGSGSVLQAIDAGTYSFSVFLRDKTNYSWEDGTTEDKRFVWVIDRKIIDMPYLVPDVFEYDGKYHTPEVRGFNPDIMYLPSWSRKGEINVGSYNITIALGDDYNGNKNYIWANGTTGNLLLPWTIVQKKLKYPILKKGIYEYNGSYQTPEVEGYNGSYMRMIGNVSQKERGTYKIGFALTNTKNYTWEDGISDDKFIPWEIVKGKLKKSEHIPVQNPELVYNGKEQTPRWDNYDASCLNFAGRMSATNAGTYTAKFTPNDNYTWEDGTIDEITVDWVINKLGLNIPTQYEALYYNGKEQEPVWLVTYHL